MKNLKKILLSVLVMMMLLASVLVVAVGAQTETAPEIVSKNIAYKGNYALQLAISADSVKGGSVKVNVYDSADKTNKLGTFSSDKTENITTNVGELTVYVVTTGGVPAKDMGKILYFEAVDAENNTSALERYSVAEYFYERLYRAGVIEAVDEESEAKQYDSVRRDFYLDALDHGKKAQNLLINCNDDPADDITFFVTDYYYISYAGHNVEGSYDSALIGSTASLTLPDFSEPAFADKGYESWNVVKYNAETYEKSESVMKPGEELYIDGHTVVTPADPSAEVPADPFVPGQGQYYNNSDIGGNRWDYSALNNVAVDGLGNSVNYSNSSGELVLTRDTSGVDSPNEGYVKYVHNGFTCLENEAKFVYETDFMFDGYKADVEAGAMIGRFDFRFGNADFLKMFEFQITAVAVDNGTVTVAKFGEIELKAGQWYNIRFEYDKASNTFDYYRNDEKVATGEAKNEKSNSAGRNWSCWYFETTTTAGVMSFDNTVAACYDANPPVGGEYFQNTSITGVRMDGDDLLSSLNSPNSTKGNDTVEIVDGELVYKKTGSGESYIRWDHSGKQTDSSLLVFEADITIDDIAMGTATYGIFANIYLSIDGTEYTVPLEFWSNHVYYKHNDGNAADIYAAQKYNIRLVVDAAAKTVDYYVDGNLVKEDAVVATGSRTNNWVRFLFKSGTTAGQFAIDNVFIGVVEGQAN